MMTKVSKKVFWDYLNSFPVPEDDADNLLFHGKYKDGSEYTVYFYRELIIGETLATVGRRTQYSINLDIKKELENE